jgi:hypothetical protein
LQPNRRRREVFCNFKSVHTPSRFRVGSRPAKVFFPTSSYIYSSSWPCYSVSVRFVFKSRVETINIILDWLLASAFTLQHHLLCYLLDRLRACGWQLSPLLTITQSITWLPSALVICNSSDSMWIINS